PTDICGFLAPNRCHRVGYQEGRKQNAHERLGATVSYDRALRHLADRMIVFHAVDCKGTFEQRHHPLRTRSTGWVPVHSPMIPTVGTSSGKPQWLHHQG